MAKSKKPTLKKPMLNTAEVMDFAEGRTKARSLPKAEKSAAVTPATTSDKSRFPPTGHIRLTINMRRDLHTKLKIDAAQSYRTISDIVIELVEGRYHK